MVNFSIRVTKFDSNVLFQFLLVSNGRLAGDRLHYGRLSVGYVANRTDVNCGLGNIRIDATIA